MKLYVLAHCAAEENYTPKVFKNKEDAVSALKKIYKECIGCGDANYVDSDELYETAAEIVYVDDTYDRLDIFEVEVK